jgi:ABC-type branched-subunit amino acid transport system permease subunit
MEINKSFVFSYLNMRKIIGILGISLPFCVIIFNLVENGFSIRGSISSYYYTNTRDIYIAIVSIISIYLISYKGYEKIDDIIGNLSGVFALGVVIFPTYFSTEYKTNVGIFLLNDRISDIIHMTFAALLFLSLSYTSIFLFTKSRGGRVSKAKRKRNIVYRICGIIMLFSIVLIITYMVFLQKTIISKIKPVLILESISLISFGISWLVKGKTFSKKKRVLTS